MGDLEDQAESFAARLTDLVNSTITTGCVFHVTLVDGLAIVRPPGRVLKTHPLLPLSIAEDPEERIRAPLWLRVRFSTTMDPEGEHLAVHSSVLGLCIDPRTNNCPLRIEYDRDQPGKQAAHLHIDGDSAGLGFAYAATTGRLRPLHKLHFPLGDRRFRPSLEDFIEFLHQEQLLTETHEGWREALNDSRGDWLHRQTRAVVRRHAGAAVEQLAAMGYTVYPPS